MDDQEREVFDQILHTKLRDYLPADSESIDFLDTLGHDLAKKGAGTSLHKSFVFNALNGRAVFTTESWFENEEISVTVLMGEDDDDDEEAFLLAFSTGNALEACSPDDDFADDAREIMHCFAADRRLTVQEKTMAMHIGSLIVVGQAECKPNLFVGSCQGVIHVADLIRSAVERLATCTKQERKYTHSIDQHRSLQASLSTTVSTRDSDTEIQEVAEFLRVTLNDAAAGRRFVYECSESGDKTLSVVPLLSHDHEPLCDQQIGGFTNYNVDLLTDTLFSRLIAIELNEQG